ncbi:MAG: hypothetical protein ACR2H2_05610 [Solirubrobacteraceae bacterium]
MPLDDCVTCGIPVLGVCLGVQCSPSVAGRGVAHASPGTRVDCLTQTPATTTRLSIDPAEPPLSLGFRSS